MTVQGQERTSIANAPETGEQDIGDVAGLRDLWAGIVRPGDAASGPIPIRPLLDTWAWAWSRPVAISVRRDHRSRRSRHGVIATAGAPGRDRLDRYHAWREGTPPPAAETRRQAAVMAQAPVFTPDDIAAWERDGVVVLKHAIDRDQAADVADHLWSILEASPDDPDTWYGAGGNGIMVQHFQHPSMDVARHSPRIAKAFAQLYGHADLIASTDRLSFNPPERDDYVFPGPHLHWDANLTAPMPFEAQAILYLTDTTADQGALRVVPGFHHRLAEGWLETLDGRDPRFIDLTPDAVPIAAGAGDLVIWRQEIPHGASPNTAAKPRMAQYVTMYPMHWPDTRPWR